MEKAFGNRTTYFALVNGALRKREILIIFEKMASFEVRLLSTYGTTYRNDPKYLKGILVLPLIQSH
jgi:hypothetical protein